MENKKQTPIVAILGGTGKEGPGLAMRWASSGLKIIIGSRQLEKAQRVAKELNQKLGIDTIEGLKNEDAARKADICVLTVVFSAHQTIIEYLKDSLKGKILVDTTARVDFRNPKPPDPPSAGRLAQNILRDDTQVVAAFQNIPAHTLREKLNETLDADVLICADDVESAEQVIHLASLGGMRAYYAGKLDNAIVVEGLTALLISMNRHYEVRTASISISGL
jgi:NADPH-dependent F420 reductase